MAHSGRLAVNPSLVHKPRILLDRGRALIVITLSYAAAILMASLLFQYVEHVRAYDDGRGEQVTIAFAVIMGTCWFVSMASILRRKKT